jgi:hypothetical protein
MQLATKFISTIGGQRPQSEVFTERKIGVIAIDCRRRRENDGYWVLRADPSRCIKNRDRAGEISPVCPDPIQTTPLDRGHRGQVEASFDTLHGLCNDPAVRDVA